MKIHEYQAKELLREYGAPVPGGNGPILEIPDVVGPNAGTYKVLAIGPDGASFSDEATLTVIRDGTVLHLR